MNENQQFLLYTAPDGEVKVEVCFKDETVWLTQKALAERFGIQSHTDLWKQMDAKNPGKGFGTLVQKTWYWYDTWMDQVRKHCQENEARYKSPTA